MRKNISLRIILIVLMAITLSMVPHVQTANAKSDPNSSNSLLGYERQVKIGSGIECGEYRFAFVIGSSEEIDTGTYVFSNPQCTTPLSDGIYTSLSGSTYGLSFYVVDGVVGEQAEAC